MKIKIYFITVFNIQNYRNFPWFSRQDILATNDDKRKEKSSSTQIS